MATKMINASYMENCLKRNWTLNDFCNDLDIDEAEFKRLLKKYFSPRVERYYLSRLSANQKLFDKTSRQGSRKEVCEVVQSVLSQDTRVEDGNEETSVNLEFYLSQEQQLIQSICDAEIEIKTLRDERKGQQIRLEKIHNTFQSLLSKIEIEREKLGEVETELNRINNIIDQTTSKKAILKKQLDQVKEKIEELKVITIMYMADGKIDVIGFDEAIPELDIDSTLSEMMEIELLEELTLKELKIMAKIVATANYVISETNRDVKFEFEKTSNISVAFELLEEMSEEKE